MRPDMSKLLTEGYRYNPYGDDTKGWNEGRGRVRGRNYEEYENLEDLPRRLSMRSNYRWNRKEFTDVLNPLYGFIKKNCGRKWNDVYSEIKGNINPNGALAHHIIGHIKDMVYTTPSYVKLITTKPYENHQGDPFYRKEYHLFHADTDHDAGDYGYARNFFYVNEEGILTRWDSKKLKIEYVYPNGRKPDSIKLSSTCKLEKINGIWYRIDFKIEDVLRYIPYSGTYRKVKEEVVKSKKQLSKKELSKYNLKNH